MITNTRRGSRVGAVRRRSQSWNPLTGRWTKRGEGGRFMDGKATRFKGVRREHRS